MNKRLTKKEVYIELRCLYAAAIINGAGQGIYPRRKAIKALYQAYKAIEPKSITRQESVGGDWNGQSK